jgi:hypothetical protein
VPRRLAAIGLALVALAVVVVRSAAAGTPGGPVEAALFRACDATLASVRTVVHNAMRSPDQTIVSEVRLPRPGTVAGTVSFDPSGQEVQVASDPAPYALGAACSGGKETGGPGRSRVVSTLREQLGKAGTYTLTFKLNFVGRRILARLGGRQRAYAKHHPHKLRPPSLAYGVGLSYSPTG